MLLLSCLFFLNVCVGEASGCCWCFKKSARSQQASFLSHSTAVNKTILCNSGKPGCAAASSKKTRISSAGEVSHSVLQMRVRFGRFRMDL